MPAPFELPGYEILEKVGEGGTSSVWKARQLSLDRLVAIKVLDTALGPDPEALARFRLEAQAAARLKHSSIVQVYDAGDVEGRPYLVMEYVDGCTLGDLLQRSGTMTEGNALLVAEAVARALAYAWDKDCIIHLDIKPDNVLVENDGAVKVTDLGLARFIGLHRRRVDTDTILGTPNYVSPEQADGVEDLDCRTDIYSLGAMLYHLVTGRLPFAGRPGSSAMDAHVTDFLEDPIDLNPGLSQATAWLIEKLMVKNRAYRPAYWSLVLADLAEVKEGRPPKPPLPEEGLSTVMRNPARSLPGPAAQPIKEQPRKRIVISEAAATQAGLHRHYDDRGIARALTQLLFLAVGAAALGFFYYLGIPQRIGLRVVAPAGAVSPEVVSAPEVVGGPVAGELDAGADAGVVWDEAAVPAPVESGMKDGVVVWENADFREGARLYNEAYAFYTEFQKTRANREQLPAVEQKAREAIRKFESCQALAPPDVDVAGFIQQCFHLIADVRHSTLLHEEEPAKTSRPAPHPSLPAPPTSVR